MRRLARLAVAACHATLAYALAVLRATVLA